MSTRSESPDHRSTSPTTPPRRAARRATSNDKFFRQLVGNMRNAVIAIHRDGTIALANDEAYRIFAISRPAGDTRRAFTDVFRERPEIVRALSAAFEMTTLPNRAELRLKDLDRVIGYTLSQVRDDDGGVIGAVMYFKDLTLVEQAEERERLRDRLASLGEMAAGIAHELKNPLAGIEVMAGLLRRQVTDIPDAQSLIADIISEAKLANAIVVEMLEFVRPVRLQVEQTDVGAVLQQAITLAETKARRGDTAVTVKTPPALPLVDGDQHQLCQVFTNLLTNAFEALGGRGQVTISAAVDAAIHDPAFAIDGQPPPPAAPVIVVEIADNGPGIAADLSERIFNPFFTTKAEGTGLGLSIVRKIVDAHDGRIDLTSAPGQGTRFRVTLPVSSNSSWFK